MSVMDFITRHFEGHPIEDDIKKEEAVERRIRRVLRRESNILGKKKRFCEQIRGAKTIDKDAVQKLRDWNRRLLELVKELLSRERIELKIDEDLHHRLTIIYANEEEREKAAQELKGTKGVTTAALAKQIQKNIHEELAAINNISKVATAAMRVLDQWKRLLKDEIRMLGNFTSKDIVNFTFHVNQEIVLLHIMLRDDKAQRKALVPMTALAREINREEDEAKKTSSQRTPAPL